MHKLLEACQECRECKFKTDPNAVACSGCGHFITPETIELRKRHQKKTSMLTLGYFMIFFVPFSIFLLFDGLKNAELSGSGSRFESALEIGLLLTALFAIGFVVYLLFLKKKH